MKNAEQFELLADLIIQKFADLLKSTDITSESDVERLRKMIEVVAVVCSVRQGSRLNSMSFVNAIDGSNLLFCLFSISNFALIRAIRCSASYNI